MINPEIFLIQSADIYSATTVFNNVDYDKLVKPFVQASQEYLMNIIGSGIYQELQSQVPVSGLTNENAYIMHYYCKPILIYYTTFLALPGIHYKVTPTGIQVQVTDTSQPAGSTGLNQLQGSYRTLAESKANQLRNYLCANPSLYPKYNNPGNELNAVYPRNNNYDCGLYLES